MNKSQPVPGNAQVYRAFQYMVRSAPLRSLFAFLLIAVPGGSTTAPAAPAKATADRATMAAALTPGGGRIVVEAQGVQPETPLFFSATVETEVRLGAARIEGEIRLNLRIVQGRPEVLTLGLSGDGDVVEVAGDGLRDWSVRRDANGIRFLDLRPVLSTGTADPREMKLVVRTRLSKPAVPGTAAVLIVTPGDAVGFTSRVVLQPETAIDLRVTSAAGMVPLAPAGIGDSHGTQEFFSTGDGRIEVRLMHRGAAAAEAEMADAQLTGLINEAAGSVDFRLRGVARVQTAGARLRVLSGRAALGERAAGEGWHVELVPAGGGGGMAYDIVFDRDGQVPIDLAIVAGVRENGDWHALDFQMPAGTVVPVRLEGLGDGVEFDPRAAVVPAATPQGWQGFLPAAGVVSFAWKRTREAGEGTLFFTSAEKTEVRVGAGLLRQASHITFRVLQGKLTGVRLRLDGPGEILGVEGANVVGWKVLPEAHARMLEVRLSRPFEGEGTLFVRSQAALGSFPVRADPVRLTPEGAVRHSGFVRVANSGAVRLEVAEVEGMMQLAPAQFPDGAAIEAGVRQVFVYRFPSAGYAFKVVANQILPEVGVSQVVTYELAETDRVISADLELEVREAALRDWSLGIPDDYAVVAVSGSDVADYVVESGAAAGRRALKVLFKRAVEGRQLVRLRLEKNQAAAPGEWRLPPLVFPGAKSVRGHIGVVSAPGYRIVPAAAGRLVEVPLGFFPKQVPGLQQAWRLREPEWSAALRIEARGQSVQADVFHLYSLKEGVVYGSVLLNYFVVGAPAGEWRIEVPATVGNIDVVGQNVRRDWRREGGEVIVSLHQPVLGAATLLITFEQPMSARGGTIKPGELRPIGVQSERGFIQVVSPLQVKYEVRTSEGGLLRLEPLELPTEFRLLTSSPSLAVYQYTARPFAFEMDVEWYQPGETVDQVVDFAKLTSQVARDGQVVTEARFFVKTRGRKALRMVLPGGMKLWEARVADEVVNARADGGQTLVPLPPRVNPNEPVEVSLRLGQSAGRSGARVSVAAPGLLVPTVIGEWTLRGDPGRLLVPGGGNVELLRPALTETGFEWISNRGRGPTGVLLALVALGGLLLRARSGWRIPVGLLAGGSAALLAFVLFVEAVASRRMNLGELTYAATMVPAGGTVAVQVANLGAFWAMISWWGLVAIVAGAGSLFASAMPSLLRAGKQRMLVGAGALLLCAGLLAQRGGAAPFFVVVGATAFVLIPVLGGMRWWKERRSRRAADTPSPDRGAGGGGAGAGAGVVASILAIASCLVIKPAEAAGTAPAGVAASEALAQQESKAAQAMIQTWRIRGSRLHAELELTLRGGPGDSFLLLKAPAVLIEFTGDGLRVGRVGRDGQAAYYIAPEREGTLTARARFEMPVTDLAEPLPLPTGPAAMQRITVELDEAGWEFSSPMAVHVMATTGLGENHSGATLVLGPEGAPVITFQPKRRDISAEATQYFAETSNLYLPGPGVVNGYIRVTIRPAQGRVSELEFEVPADFTVGDAGRGPVGAWQFDPEKRRLRLAIEPAQTQAFQFDLETQRGTVPLPVDLALEPVRVIGAAGEVGMMALAFDADAQPEGVRASGLSPVNLEDFDAGLLPRTREGQPAAVLQQVWRYGREDGRVDLKVAPVAPEVRVSGRSVLSLGDDRLVMAVDLNVSITRVGLFRLSFALPEGLEVEALSGPALSHWTESEENGARVVTLHLNGRTIGEQAFAVTLAGAAPGPREAWAVPSLSLREATRQTGEFLIVPEKGIRVRAVDREHVSQLDPRAAGGTQPGTLAFRLLQENWMVRVGIEALDPWVTVQSLLEMTAREGQTLTRIALLFRVENASVKQLRVRLPDLQEDQVRTVRATGAAVSDFVAIPGEPGVWEIRFQRGIVGETDVQIEYQGQASREQGSEAVATPEFPGVKQAVQFVAFRGGGRLEVAAGELPRGWQRTDWSSIPANLQDRSDRSVPALCFRVTEPEAALAVTVRRHAVADSLKLRVTAGELTTIFSPAGPFLTAVNLQVDVVEKGPLRVRLPEGSRLFSAVVNSESVAVVRERDAWLFHVSPNTGADKSAAVRLVYAVPESQHGRISLVAPGLSVPLENVTWRVVIPPGYELEDYQGGLRLRDERAAGFFDVEQYKSLVVSKRSAEAKKAVAMLEEANALVMRGDQQQAGEMFSRAARAGALDEASNEDARVQLRVLKTQQAVLGLNTRRQKLYLDNRGDAARNEQLEQAATLNPFLQGNTNFDPQQVDQLLMGNTVEENAALRGIASRIVDQQLAAEPAPGAIDVTLPERGRVLTFTRSLQVDGGKPLELTLDIGKAGRASPIFVTMILMAIVVIAGVVFPTARRRKNGAEGTV